MNVLLINKYYYLKGGSEKYLFDLENLLNEKGDQTHIFSMTDKKNKPSSDLKYFIDNLDFKKNSAWQNIAELKRSLYRTESADRLKKMIRETAPQVAHLNNINFQLTTSVIDCLQKNGIPMVMTLHDYQLVSPNHLMYQPGHWCPKCFSKKFYHCVLTKCYNNSLAYSFMAALESYFNHLRGVYHKIDVFISPSRFMKQKMIDFGFEAEKIKVLPNFLKTEGYHPLTAEAKGDYYLYVGRLEEEKGIGELIEFFQTRQEKLVIIGTGSLAEKVQELSVKNISYLGKLPNPEVRSYLAKAKYLIVPSKWPENCPYVVIEAKALGTPVIVKAVGGLPEMVNHGQDGYIYENDRALKDILSKPNQDYARLCRNSLNSVLNYSSENYYRELLKVYQALLEAKTLTINRIKPKI